jgi:hypothetical protein
MTFLAPLALVGLLAALVPPLLHLFQRREPPARPFPAVRYLRESAREARQSVRLVHALLMALRIAAVVLLVLAAARPVVPSRGAAVHEPTAVVLVVDNSLSSGAVVRGEQVLDALAARARGTLAAAGRADALWLLTADGVARRDGPAALDAAVAALTPTAGRLDLAQSVRTAAGLVRASGYARGEVHVLSDLQASALADPVPDSSAVGLAVLVWHPAGEPPANHGVAEARPVPAVWASGAGGVAVAVVGGDGASAPATVRLLVGERAGARGVAARGGTLALAAPALTPGWYAGAVLLEPDELRADDARPFAARVVPVPDVAVGADADPGRFLTEALDVLAAAGRVRLVQPGGVRFGLPRAGSAAATIVLPPADPSRLGAVNRALDAAGVPWRFGAPLTAGDSVLNAEVPEVAGVRVATLRPLEPVAGADSAEVLMRVGPAPWLVRHGRTVLVASRLVPEETALPLGPAFVPFVAALTSRVAHGESGVRTAVPGGPVAVPAGARALEVAGSASPVRAGDVLAAPSAVGVHAFRSGNDTVGLLVVAPDPRESELARAAPADVARRFPGAAVTVTSDTAVYAATRFHGAGRSEIGGALLLAALAVLVAEALLAAGMLGRRG